MDELWSRLFEVFGAGFEVWGALLLANRYLRRATIPSIIWGLLSVVWEGQAAEDLAFLGEISNERALSSLRGILLLIIGFIIRSFPNVFFLTDSLLRQIKILFG